MEQDINETSPDNAAVQLIPESPKPMAFTIDFGGGKSFDTTRHKNLVEKYQKRHRRGQSLSKLDDCPTNPATKKHPSTGNLPRKSSFQSEGYFSSDEKSDRVKNVRASAAKRCELTLPLKNMTSDKMMTQSYPSGDLSCITSPDLELKDVSSPELDLISPYSPKITNNNNELPAELSPVIENNKLIHTSSPVLCENNKSNNSELLSDEIFVDGNEFDFDKSDTVSDAGTYTLDAENYSEEQKERMSIDCQFKIEQVSMLQKTQDYIQNLGMYSMEKIQRTSISRSSLPANMAKKRNDILTKISQLSSMDKIVEPPLLLSPNETNRFTPQKTLLYKNNSKMLSPILSPTQNLSIIQDTEIKSNKIYEETPVKQQQQQHMNNGTNDSLNKTFSKIIFPSPQAKHGNGLEQISDQGSVISVTSSGAFRTKNEPEKKLARKLSLTKSEVHVETYVDDVFPPVNQVQKTSKLTANIVNVQSISTSKSIDSDKNGCDSTEDDSSSIVSGNLVLGKVSNLPPPIGGFSGKNSPTKIPSPIHTITRPRSRSSISSLNIDLSDSSLETESYLKPTANIIHTLQQRLSLDSDQDSDYESKYAMQLNNSAQNLLKQKARHIRHNSLDDRTIKISNKLEHFQNKNFQDIDQTYTNLFNQYNQNKVIHKIQNSPNNSPIRRSSSFSTQKNQINSQTKNTNICIQKESNLRNSPSLTRNSNSIQRSASTASIKPQYIQFRRASISDHQKIDRNQFGDTESSSEDDFEKNLMKKKDLSNLTNTRYNRAFSLRRGRLESDSAAPQKCPNTPEMRRKFQSDNIRAERAISVDRKPTKTADVQSRYLLNITKKAPMLPLKSEPVQNVPKVTNKLTPNKPQVFSRTDSGRFSMRTTKPSTNSTGPKSSKKDLNGKKSGGRSNSSLSSKEVEFQNWKRRKSYDPMKAAAEGKRKELAKKQGMGSMTQSYSEANQGQDCDSSPSHSSSVHRSQSFHGTAALGQLISSDEEEDDLTLSADEGFSPPTPSPCELSPARASLRNALRERILH